MSVLIYTKRWPRHECFLRSVLAISLCITEWVSVCLLVYSEDVFHTYESHCCLRVFCLCLTRTNGYSSILSCSTQGVTLSAWDSQCDSDLGTATKLGRHAGKMDDFVQPKNMKFFPLYMCACLCLGKNNIGGTPSSEVNVRAR